VLANWSIYIYHP